MRSQRVRRTVLADTVSLTAAEAAVVAASWLLVLREHGRALLGEPSLHHPLDSGRFVESTAVWLVESSALSVGHH
jgi:hypothetical protein